MTTFRFAMFECVCASLVAETMGHDPAATTTEPPEDAGESNAVEPDLRQCASWNTARFFAGSDSGDFVACLDAGADSNVLVDD